MTANVPSELNLKDEIDYWNNTIMESVLIQVSVDAVSEAGHVEIIFAGELPDIKPDGIFKRLMNWLNTHTHTN